jgi:cytoskeleton protein RodZ
MADSEPSSPSPAAAAEPAAPEAPQTLGQALRSARLAQDLTVEQLSTELRIEAKQLTALEENRFELIGVPVFIKGYLKQYGLRLGLDVSDLLAMYYKQTTLADVEIQPRRTIKLRDERQITSWILAVLVLLTLVVGLAVWWWSGGSFGTALGIRSTPVTTTPSDIEAPEPQGPPAAAPVVVPLERTLPAVDPPAADPPAADPGQEAAPGELPAVAAAETGDGDDAGAAPAATTLELTFDQESWAEITDARGERLLFGLSAAGRNVTVRGEPPFAILLGNADAVRLTVDGEPYAIPRSRQGNLARFAVDTPEE